MFRHVYSYHQIEGRFDEMDDILQKEGARGAKLVTILLKPPEEQSGSKPRFDYVFAKKTFQPHPKAKLMSPLF